MNREDLRKCYLVAQERCIKKKSSEAWIFEEEFADAILQHAEREVKKIRANIYTRHDAGGCDRGADWALDQAMQTLQRLQSNDGTK